MVERFHHGAGAYYVLASDYDALAADLEGIEARIVQIEAELAIVTKDRDTLLEMTGATIQQVAARLRQVSETDVYRRAPASTTIINESPIESAVIGKLETPAGLQWHTVHCDAYGIGGSPNGKPCTCGYAAEWDSTDAQQYRDQCGG